MLIGLVVFLIASLPLDFVSFLVILSFKQSVIACSTAEVEYRAMARVTAEVVWLRWPLSDMDVTLFPYTSLL